MNNNNDLGQGSNDADSIYRAPAADTSVAPAGDLLSAYVGPKNTAYYSSHFDRIKNSGGAVSWNWPAFLISSVWFLYRKMWLNAFLYWIVLPISLGTLSGVLALAIGDVAANAIYSLGYLLIAFVLTPMYANYLYFRHAQSKVDKVSAMPMSDDARATELSRIGGVSNVALVVVPIILVFLIGVIAAISIPAYQDYTVRAQVAEGLNLSGGAKAAVAEHYYDSGQMPANNEAAGLSPARQITGNYVSGVAIKNGNVIVTYGNQAHGIIDGKTLIFTPDASGDVVEWSCSSPSIGAAQLPAACR